MRWTKSRVSIPAIRQTAIIMYVGIIRPARLLRLGTGEEYGVRIIILTTHGYYGRKKVLPVVCSQVQRLTMVIFIHIVAYVIWDYPLITQMRIRKI